MTTNSYIKQYPDLMAGKKIMYVHGFGSSAQSGTVTRLRDMLPSATVIAEDIPVRPAEGFAMLLKMAETERPDLIIGKPYVGIVEAALERTGLRADQLAMVGDRLYTDVETGLRHGMTAILVMSGETTPDMLAASDTVPDLVYGRLSDMIPEL